MQAWCGGWVQTLLRSYVDERSEVDDAGGGTQWDWWGWRWRLSCFRWYEWVDSWDMIDLYIWEEERMDVGIISRSVGWTLKFAGGKEWPWPVDIHSFQMLKGYHKYLARINFFCLSLLNAFPLCKDTCGRHPRVCLRQGLLSTHKEPRDIWSHIQNS